MQRVLITGGNGFLGSNLVRALLKNGSEVCVVSRSYSNIIDIKDSIQFLQHTDLGYNEHEDAILTFSPDTVIHCAWDGGNSYKDVDSPTQVYRNIPSGLDLLQIVSRLSVKPVFVGLGSFAEYGVFSSPVSEISVENPITLYGISKLSFKNISKLICDQHSMRWVWIRPLYIYGRGDVTTRLIPSLFRKFSLGQPAVLDSCNTTIDYLHIDDFCRGVMCILQKKYYGVFNLCSGESYQLKDVIQCLHRVCNSSSYTIFDSSIDRTKLNKYAVGDNFKLRSIGWNPTITLEDGLKSLTEYTDFDGLHSEF
jgi:nucleoside-diphosphate-sugar epimerase